jgi:hypothetical protein
VTEPTEITLAGYRQRHGKETVVEKRATDARQWAVKTHLEETKAPRSVFRRTGSNAPFGVSLRTFDLKARSHRTIKASGQSQSSLIKSATQQSLACGKRRRIGRIGVARPGGLGVRAWHLHPLNRPRATGRVAEISDNELGPP